MLRYTTDRARPGLVALYDIRPGNGAGQVLQPRRRHGAIVPQEYEIYHVGPGGGQDKHTIKQTVGGRPPRYAPPLSSPVGAEAPRAAEQTAT